MLLKDYLLHQDADLDHLPHDNIQDSQCRCPFECENSPCSCGELDNCQVCHEESGCAQCKDGYFKKDYNYPCVNCQTVFGDSCMFCQDLNGCGQCKQGFIRTFDDSCQMWFCKEA